MAIAIDSRRAVSPRVTGYTQERKAVENVVLSKLSDPMGPRTPPEVISSLVTSDISARTAREAIWNLIDSGKVELTSGLTLAVVDNEK